MKVLVPGASGQLAQEVIKLCGASNIEVAAPPEAELDITDFSRVSSIVSGVKPDIVINCAAFNDVDGAESRWQDAFLVNGIAVKNLALACKKTGSVLVHFSTDYVFDGESGKPYTIADFPSPISSYGQSKLLGEELLREHGERYFLIRTSWVFGRGKHSFPLKLLEWASKNRTLRVVDDQVASPTYAADLAEAVMKLAKTERYGMYHITNSGHVSRYGWAEFVLKKVGWDGTLEPAKSEEFNTPAVRPKFSVLDNFPLSETLGGMLPPWQDATERFLKETG
jgi:dTDP-4-dehydrorhamnose reductase